MAAHDVMPDIELFQPVTVEDASTIAARLKGAGWILAGGQDTYGWLKDRAKTPGAMIDLAAIGGINEIAATESGISIGAMTTLRDVIGNSLVAEKFPILTQAAARVASPQIRNQGTLGGNVAQDTRCWYYRRGLSCYRAGGNICYADSPEGMNREHALFGASRCVAVSPSDTATALVALDATMVIHREGRESRVPADQFFISPTINIRHMTVLRPGDILTHVEIPDTWANSEFYFEKIADRDVWDFALVSIAAVMKTRDGVIDDARIVCGAVECVPKRLYSVEQAVRGKARNEQTADAVAGLASKGARSLNHNQFKVPLMENLVRRALRT